MELVTLLDKFIKLDRKLKREYWQYPNIEQIFEEYGQKLKQLQFRFLIARPNDAEKHPIIKLIEEMMSLRKEISQRLFHYSIVENIDDDFIDKIKRFRRRNGYFFDRVYRELADKGGVDYNLEFDLNFDVFHSLIAVEDIGRRIIQIASWLIFKDTPDIIIYHINNIKNCYATGQFEAAICYCRALIELSGFDYLKRKKNNIR